MFSLNRKIKHQDSESIPVHKEDVARLAISADGERVFTNETFRTLARSRKSDVDFRFNWLIAPDNTSYLVGSETETQAETDFLALSDLSGEIMVVVDDGGEIVRFNAAFQDLFGETKTDFLDLFHSEDKPYIRSTIRSIGFDEPEDNAPTDFQARIVTKSGAARWVEWRQRRSSGRLYCVGRDVTAIREQQMALGRRERQLGQAESIGRLGHWNWTLGQDDIQWSEELYNIFGVDKNNFTPTVQSMMALVHKSDRARADHGFQRAGLGQQNYEMDFRITRPGGDVRYLRCEGRCAQDSNGEVTALYGIMQDMTERTLHERELKQSKEAVERAYAAKTQFLANMSHELRTPLNAIIGFSEMMYRQLLGPIGTEKYLEYIQGIRESGEHLLDLISDILDMSKIEAGKYELGFEEVNVAKTVRLAAHMMESRASDAAVRIDMEKLGDENLHIIADRRAILQVILNILSNAVKFTPKGGHVQIECTEKKESVMLKITDNGIGIPANKLASITNPFEQVSSHYTRDHEGTGLGLAITKELVEMHGGSLLIDSKVGAGTSVTIRLPRDASEKQKPKN
ncbi:MAG TPA: ATP-binding protein [Alphaproteobacteria bacterium]|nr:PAS domain-containing protein [Micavibrio sp.]MBK9562613.1 PAS domain-containing protein [Micavibrio sp.]HQX26313.1 ATP-binding protein [Alphaproteobacteria bacterium]